MWTHSKSGCKCTGSPPSHTLLPKEEECDDECCKADTDTDTHIYLITCAVFSTSRARRGCGRSWGVRSCLRWNVFTSYTANETGRYWSARYSCSEPMSIFAAGGIQVGFIARAQGSILTSAQLYCCCRHVSLDMRYQHLGCVTSLILTNGVKLTEREFTRSDSDASGILPCIIGTRISPDRNPSIVISNQASGRSCA